MHRLDATHVINAGEMTNIGTANWQHHMQDRNVGAFVLDSVVHAHTDYAELLRQAMMFRDCIN